MKAKTPVYTYRVATAGDDAAILDVFEEVAPEVPTSVFPDTHVMIKRLTASGHSLVAVDGVGKIIAYALAEQHDPTTLSLVYLGVSKSARNQHISSSLISKLQEIGDPILTDVRSDNKSDMVGRFKRFGFCEIPTVFSGKTKLRWQPAAAEN